MAERLGIAQQRDAVVVGDVEPLVRVRGPGVRLGQALDEFATGRVRQCPQAEGSVDVQPSAALTGPGHDLRERVERSGVDLTRLRADEDRPADVGEELCPYAALRIGRDSDDPVAPQPDQAECLDQRGVGLLPGYHRQRRCAEQTLGVDVPTQPGEQLISRCGQRGGVRHGGAGDERCGGAVR